MTVMLLCQGEYCLYFEMVDKVTDLTVSSNRPVRSSKQKAISQVKQWVGNISDDDGTGGLKRRHDTDDSDEDFDDKKIKLEDDSDYSDKEIKPKISIKKGNYCN